MNYMIARSEDTKRILLDEIAVVIIENNAVSMTGCLLSELAKKKIKVILCDNERNPQVEMVSLYGTHNDSKRIREQIRWSDDNKSAVWTRIVQEKIRNQSLVLRKHEKCTESDMLKKYTEEIQNGDVTNREGHAAKVYFNALFGMKFTRSDEENVLNAALDYGYSLLLSAFNREVVANGYLTQLGLGHDNQFNHFNLSCDLMEPFRVLVDELVENKRYERLTTEEKHELVNLLNSQVRIRETEQTVLNAIKIYTKSVFDALTEENLELIRFIEI